MEGEKRGSVLVLLARAATRLLARWAALDGVKGAGERDADRCAATSRCASAIMPQRLAIASWLG